MDERYIMHRLYATRFAAVISAIMIGFWICYEFYLHHVFRWDFFVVILAMGVAKIGALLYYRFTN
jgi:hypothetical protein